MIDLPIAVRAIAPMIIRIVCTKSVHTTAVRPPVIVNTAATASSANILAYVSSFNDCSINIAPAYKSDWMWVKELTFIESLIPLLGHIEQW